MGGKEHLLQKGYVTLDFIQADSVQRASEIAGPHALVKHNAGKLFVFLAVHYLMIFLDSGPLYSVSAVLCNGCPLAMQEKVATCSKWNSLISHSHIAVIYYPHIYYVKIL